MIIFGLVLLLLDLLFFHTGVLFWIGVVILVVGLALALFGTVGGHPVGRRRHYW